MKKLCNISTLESWKGLIKHLTVFKIIVLRFNSVYAFEGGRKKLILWIQKELGWSVGYTEHQFICICLCSCRTARESKAQASMMAEVRPWIPVIPALEGKTEATVICFSFSPSSSIFIHVTRDRITLTALKGEVGHFRQLPAIFVINEEPYPCAQSELQNSERVLGSSTVRIRDLTLCCWRQGPVSGITAVSCFSHLF